MIPAHQFVGSADAPHLAYLMHGVLGAGHNLRSLARNLVARRADYRIALIDLRYHGASLGAPPPHTLASCVDDLLDLNQALGRSPRVVLGHSLGGKVALGYGRRHESRDPGERAVALGQQTKLRQVWTLDSDPGAQEPGGNHEVQKVLAALKKNPGPFQNRREAVAAIVGEGLSTGLANWLGTSLLKSELGFRWRFDLEQVEMLLDDYFLQDLWPFLETRKTIAESAAISYELLLAERSDRWSGSMKERAACLATLPRINIHRLANSGHWVHVDNPEGLLEILETHLAQ